MEVELVSKKTIKPTSSAIHHQGPFKLSLFDQFLPALYFPIILFYPANGAHSSIAEISAQLQKSLSETLSTFYMFSGRVRNESCIDNYDEGVTFEETKVNISLSEFLQNPVINMLNQFLPWPPLAPLSNSETSPMIAIQLNSFQCGGVALGVCFFHKVFDATSAGAFLKSWTANHTGGSNTKDLNPDLLQGPLRFPQIEYSSSLTHFSLQRDKSVFGGRKLSVRRYVFDAKAIATLRTKARSERVDNPTRIETISSFIWKHFSAASRKISKSPSSFSLHAVNMRHRMIPPLPKASIGNSVMVALAGPCNLEETDGMKLHDLVALTRKAISDVNAEFISQFEGEKCYQAAPMMLDLLSKLSENILFSSWLWTGFNDFEFGLGKPLWSAILGGVGPIASNLTIIKEPRSNSKDLEAWVMLEEPIMDILEQDSEFLAFATPNPSVLP